MASEPAAKDNPARDERLRREVADVLSPPMTDCGSRRAEPSRRYGDDCPYTRHSSAQAFKPEALAKAIAASVREHGVPAIKAALAVFGLRIEVATDGR